MNAQQGVRKRSAGGQDRSSRGGRGGQSGQSHSVNQSHRVKEIKGFRYYVSKYIVYFVMLVVMVYIVVNFISQQPHINKMKAELQEIQVSIEDANKENARLKEEKKDMNTKEYKERVAREKLGLVKKGEKIFIDINE